MNTRGFSAYNLARGTLLNSKLTLADSGNQPLKLLDIVISGMGMDSSAGLWLTPLQGTPAVPRVFPFDLVYLDNEYRVLCTAEMGPGIEFPAFRAEAASALVLPPETLQRTETAEGDHLLVCASDELEGLLAISSLPRPDTAESAPQAVAPMRSGSRPARPGTIELTPESPVAPASDATPFEQSVLTAVAKVAETRNTEPKPLADIPQQSVPGPSMAVTEVVLDTTRTVQPAVIEHRIDPEDLFSNWVVAAPPAPALPRSARPEPPAAAKPVPAAPETAKQNGRKSKYPPETQTPGRAASADSSAAKAPARFASEGESKTRLASSGTPDVSAGDQAQVAQALPATTFTAAPYGMWQISMPTAVASMVGAKSPQPAAKVPPAASEPAPKQAEGPRNQSVVPVTARTPDPAFEREVRMSSSSAPESKPKAEAAASQPFVNPPKSVARDMSISEGQRPGDFVASLQEKLKRVQQSRPAPGTERVSEAAVAAPADIAKPVSPSLVSLQRSAAEISPTAARPARPKPATPPPLRAKAAPPPAPAKPKEEPTSGGLRSKFRQWLHPTSSSSDRRRESRRYVPGMVAHYFTGGAPRPKNVADISMSGMYLLTDDRWMPGTMIQMTLQKPCASGEKKQSINVLSRIVRRGSDGVAAEFIMPDALPHISHDIQPSQATDKFALARFL